MATLRIGFSITPDGLGAGDGRADPEQARDLTLTSGEKAETVVTVAASTPSTSTTLWQATNHAASATAASADLAVVLVDPLTDEDTPIPLGVMASYTTDSATTVTDTVFEQAYPGVPLCFPGTVRLPAGDLAYLTKLAARNRNTGTDDAMKVRTTVWK
jgi:hypothetical protein